MSTPRRRTPPNHPPTGTDPTPTTDTPADQAPPAEQAGADQALTVQENTATPARGARRPAKPRRVTPTTPTAPDSTAAARADVVPVIPVDTTTVDVSDTEPDTGPVTVPDGGREDDAATGPPVGQGSGPVTTTGPTPTSALSERVEVVQPVAAVGPVGPVAPDPAPPAGDTASGKGGEGKSSQASLLVSLAVGCFNLVQGQDGRPYAVDRDGPNIALPLRGRDGLRQRLARSFYRETGIAAGGSALADALTVIEGMAAESPTVPVGLRTARHGAGVVVDLGDPTGRAVVVDPGRWRLVEVSPVLFRRTTLTGALPVPGGTATLAGLRELLNVDDSGFRLLVGWLIAALVPDIPHPILALLGEQGTAKSTAARFAVTLIDPSPAPLRTPPKDLRAWAVTASASWTVALDNVSTIPGWFSDTLCKAVTGDGIVDRALYTDDDVTVMAFRRVIALTSIDAGALAGDLAERMIPVELQTIPTDGRRPEADIDAAFHLAAPAALAALLDLLAAVLAALPAVHLVALPRMADFARLLAALDTVTGWDTLPAYLTATAENNRVVLDSDPFALAVLDLLRGQAVGWTGTATDLLAAITPTHPDRTWPRTGRAASGHLRRIAPALRDSGITVHAERTEHARLITLLHTDTPPFREDPK